MDNTQLMLQIQAMQEQLENSENHKEEQKKKNMLLYGSIAVNGVILLIVLFALLGGWIAVLIFYALIATSAFVYVLSRLINTVNDYKDILEGQAEDNRQMISNLSPFLKSESSFAYTEEVKGIVAMVNAYAKRMILRLEELDTEQEKEVKEKKKLTFFEKLSIYKRRTPEPPSRFGGIPIGGNPTQGQRFRNG